MSVSKRELQIAFMAYRVAMKFKTQESLQEYLRKYPHADRSKHWVEPTSKDSKPTEQGATPKPVPKSAPKATPKTSPKTPAKPKTNSTERAKPADIKDAIGVVKEWGANTSTYNFEGVDKYFEGAENRTPEAIKLSDVDIFHDHGRRVPDSNLDNPIIVMKMPSGRYKAIDGQHRVLTRKDKKLEDVKAVVITPEWEGMGKRKGIQRYRVK